MSENLVVSFILKMVNEIVGPAKEAAHDLDSIGKAAAEAAKPVGLVGTELEDMISPARQAAKEASDTANDIARMGKLSHGALSEMEKAAQAAGLTVAGYELRLKRLAKQEADETKEARAAADALEDIVGPARDVARETEDAARAMADAARPTADLADKLDDAGDAMDATTKKGHGLKLYLGVDLVNAVRLAGQAIGAMVNGIADIGKGIVHWFSDEAHAAEAVANAAEAAGMGSRAFQRLDYAFKRNDLSAQDLDGSIRALYQNMTLAQAGGKKQAAVFQSLGIRLKDTTGHYKTADIVMGEVADKFAKMPNSMLKAEKAALLFGSAGARLIPLLNQGSAGIKALGDQAEDLHLILSDKTILDSKALNDAWEDLEDTTTGLKNELWTGLAPVLTSLVRHIDELIEQNREDILKGLHDGLEWVDEHREDILEFMTEFVGFLKDTAVFAKETGDRIEVLTDALDSYYKMLGDGWEKLPAPLRWLITEGAKFTGPGLIFSGGEAILSNKAQSVNAQPAAMVPSDNPAAHLKISFDEMQRPIVKSLTSTPNLTTTVDTGSLVLP